MEKWELLLERDGTRESDYRRELFTNAADVPPPAPFVSVFIPRREWVEMSRPDEITVIIRPGYHIEEL
jgi:hypothetical protein